MSPNLRIAVADDEPDMRDYFQKILPVLGHTVMSAASTGKELVDHCSRYQPDLVISDIKMPDMDGIDAATEIYRKSAVPVILVSAYHDADLIARIEKMTGPVARENVCDGYFSVGHRNALAGDAATAKQAFQNAVDRCSVVTFEYHAAKAWLKQLGA